MPATSHQFRLATDSALILDVCEEVAQFLDLVTLARFCDVCVSLRRRLLLATRTWSRHTAHLHRFAAALRSEEDVLVFKRLALRLDTVRRFWRQRRDLPDLLPLALRIGTVHEEHMIAWHGYIGTRNVIRTFATEQVVGTIPKHSDLITSEHWLVTMQRQRRTCMLRIAQRPAKLGSPVVFNELAFPTNRVWLVDIQSDMLVTHAEMHTPHSSLVVRVVKLSALANVSTVIYERAHYRRPVKLRHFGFWALAAHKRDFLLGHLLPSGRCNVQIVPVPSRWINAGFRINIMFANKELVIVSLTSSSDDRIECLDVGEPQPYPAALSPEPRSALTLRWSVAAQHPNNRVLILCNMAVIFSNEDLFGECAVDIRRLDTGAPASRAIQVPFGRIIQVSAEEFMLTQERFDQTLGYYRVVQETPQLAAYGPPLWNITCVWRQNLYRVIVPPSLTQVAFVPTRASEQWFLVDVRSALGQFTEADVLCSVKAETSVRHSDDKTAADAAPPGKRNSIFKRLLGRA